MHTKPSSKKKFINILKEAKNLEDLNDALAEIRVPYTKGEGNRFKDNVWLVRKSAKNKYLQVDFASMLDPFPIAVCKVYFFLKMYGYLGHKPKNPAQKAAEYRKCVRELFTVRPGVLSLMALQKGDVRLFIQNNKELKAASTYHKLIVFKKGANLTDIIPGFLRMSKIAFNETEFLELEDRYFEGIREARKPGSSSRPPYPFEDLSIIMPVAFDLIEHGRNILDLMERLTNANFFNVLTPERHKYLAGYKTLKVLKKETGDTVLDSLIQEVKATKSHFVYSKDGKTKGHAIKKMRTRINTQISLLESACAIVVLVLTAMRRHELARLSRQLEIDGGDDQMLHKVIYKTSASLSGDNHAMPMPEVGVNALKLLSRLAFIRDNQKEGSIISLQDYSFSNASESDMNLENRVNIIVEKLPKLLKLTHLTPHQLRHVMAYLVMHVVGKDGLEVVRYLLGHTSILMTLTYLSRVNPFFREALEEITKIQSKENLEAMYASMQKGKKVYGAKAASFNGIIDNNLIEIMYEYWGDKIDQGWMMILLTPMAMCMHDLNNPGEMKCQRGLDTGDLVGIIPIPARCDPDGCSSALYLEDHVVKVMALAEDANKELQNNEIFQRLGENLYFNPNDFSIEKESGFKSIIDEYLTDQKKAI